jgi:pimeloyl-[acyl-carrier protein] synthase
MTSTAMRFDPFTPAALDDPYPQYARLRTEDPVHWSEKLQSWIVTRYDDVCAVLRDDARFTADRLRASRAARRSTDPAPSALRTISSDPPACLPVRAILNATLAPRVRAIRARVGTLVEILLDRVAAAGARGEVDLVAEFAHPLPITVIAELLGVPEVDRPQFEAWSRVIAQGMDRFYSSDAARETMQAMGLYFLQLVQARRGASPTDDLVSDMVLAEHRGERLSELEVVAMCTGLVFGGHETTANLIGGGMLALLRHPDELERVRTDAGLVAAAVEELLRYDTPPQFISRVATSSFDFGGRTLNSGDSVLVGLGSANRDPAAFDAPDRLDVGRAPNPHVAFGLGTHFCPGAQLSRIEARAAIPGLLARFPRLRPGSGEIVRRPTVILRGLDRLPVRVD